MGTQANLVEAHRFLLQRRFADAVRVCEQMPRGGRLDREADELLDIARAATRSGTLATQPQFRLGGVLQRAGLYAEAARTYRAVLEQLPHAAEVHNNLGSVLQAMGDTDAAAACFEQALQLKPGYVRALNNLGGLYVQTGRAAQARRLLERAVELDPVHVDAWVNLGAALRAAGELEAAAAAYRHAIVLRPEHLLAHFNLANLLKQQGDVTSALDECAAACRLDRAAPGPHALHAVMLASVGRSADAEEALRELAGAAPAAAPVALLLAPQLERCGFVAAAAAFAGSALQRTPGHANLRLETARLERALRHYDEARALVAPLLTDDAGAEPWSSLGFTLLQDAAERRDTGRLEHAIQAFKRVLAIEPERLAERLALALALTDRDRGAEAIPHIEAVLAAGPTEAQTAAAAAALLEIEGMSVEPRRYEALVAAIRGTVESGGGSVPPLHVALRFDDPALAQAAARQFVTSLGIAVAAPRAGVQRGTARLRIGYLSQDLHNHPVAYAMAPVIEAHDRSRFEIAGIAIHPDDGSDQARRIRSAFDVFVDGTGLETEALDALIRGLDLDVLVDLGGLTANARPRALALRPAPVQASYLGYPLTTGSAWTDYVIADRFVIPPDSRGYFDEQVVWLPDTFMPGEPPSDARVAAQSRAAEGLPDDAFVFCNFNQAQRLNPPAVDAFLRILKAVPGSVLWLRDPGEGRATVLRERAASQGVDAGRLVFARYAASRTDHLARLALADLFLDSLPYNAHTTAREALAAGVPVLTCAGRAFAGRVAGSLLTSLGIDELITSSAGDFEARATALAADRAAVAALRTRLVAARRASSAFDPARQARQLEAAYLAMHARSAAGEAPAPIAVELP